MKKEIFQQEAWIGNWHPFCLGCQNLGTGALWVSLKKKLLMFFLFVFCFFKCGLGTSPRCLLHLLCPPLSLPFSLLPLYLLTSTNVFNISIYKQCLTHLLLHFKQLSQHSQTVCNASKIVLPWVTFSVSADKVKTLHMYCGLESTRTFAIQNSEDQLLLKGEYHSGSSVSCSLD